jgi:glutamate N-acetyltransferase/amino-acid N-acetyltransferase
MNGFKFAGIHSGIKKNGALDLGLIFSEKVCSSAAVFTKNRVVAAPIISGKEKIKIGKCQAILVNSGNANCFTGNQGLLDAHHCSKLVADQLSIPDEHVIVSSTGVIGQPLPMKCFESGIPQICNLLDENGIEDFGQAILTTDTKRKIVTQSTIIDGEKLVITGVAKGSGMICPDMATMLGFIMIDAGISSDELKNCLAISVENSFNRISIDGDTSTNDSVFALANGSGNVNLDTVEKRKAFQTLLDSVCLKLSEKIVKDGEGATKLIRINVKGAVSKKDAYNVSRTIAHSNLVKTAVYGEDPNWGRITAAAGRSGAAVDQDKMDLFIENELLVKRGQWLGSKAEQKIAELMKKDELTITLDLNMGDKQDFYLFCDFSEAYVTINADYRS